MKDTSFKEGRKKFASCEVLMQHLLSLLVTTGCTVDTGLGSGKVEV
jgi:hypothetical protein